MSASEGNADIAKASAFRIYEYTPWCDDPKQTKIQRSLASVNAL